MPADAPTIASGNGQGKTRLLTRDQIDGRTKARKQFDAIAGGIAEDLGGESQLSTIQRHLVEAFAGAAVHMHDLNTRLLLGEQVDILAHSQAISTCGNNRRYSLESRMRCRRRLALMPRRSENEV